MPDPTTAITGGLSLVSSFLKDDASEGSSNTQINAASQAMGQNQKNFDYIAKLFEPYRASGVQALTGQGDILGLNGNQSQQAILDNIQQSPIFQGLMKQGENSILQNASATGGLRGGNTQQALAQFSPNLLNTLLQQRLQGFQGLTNTGLNSIGSMAGASQNLANNNSQLIQDQGVYRAGAIQAQGANQAGLLGNIGRVIGGIGENTQPLGGFLGGGSNVFGGGFNPTNTLSNLGNLSFGMI